MRQRPWLVLVGGVGGLLLLMAAGLSFYAPQAHPAKAEPPQRPGSDLVRGPQRNHFLATTSFFHDPSNPSYRTRSCVALLRAASALVPTPGWLSYHGPDAYIPHHF